MKLAVISTGVFPVHPPAGTTGYSGLEVIAWLVARGLAAKGHQVSLMAPDGSSCPGVDVIPTGPAGTWDEASQYGKYWQELPKQDVIIDHTWTKSSFLLKMEGRLKIPVLACCHAPIDTMYRSLPPVEKPCFVCISEDQASHFRGLFGRDCRVARNGLDIDFYKPLGIPRTNRFLFLGRFSTIKGPDIGIEACKRAGVGLDLIGDTSITNEPEFLAACKKQCDGEQIRLIGPANRSACPWWFSQAHCFLHPNARFREPLGLAPLEAQACGTPVIAWRYGALRETVVEGDTGWLVDSMDQLVDCVNQAKKGISDAMRNRCREWVADNFTVQHMVNRYEQLAIEAKDTGGW